MGLPHKEGNSMTNAAPWWAERAAANDAAVVALMASDDSWVERSLLPRVSRSDGCWEWTGPIDKAGYGRVRMPRPSRKRLLAHRVMYLCFVGPIGNGLEVDHRCRNRGCVNPAHLDQVDSQENLRRRPVSVGRANWTHCVNGHPLDGPEARIAPSSKAVGYRRCLTCNIAHSNERDKKIAEARRRLGITHVEYVRQYGKSVKVAEQLLLG
jgi:HNH endonuclease